MSATNFEVTLSPPPILNVTLATPPALEVELTGTQLIYPDPQPTPLTQESWVHRFVKSGVIVQPNTPHRIEFANTMSGGRRAYFDPFEMDISSWLPSFADPYVSTFNITLSLNFAEEPSGYVLLSMGAKLYDFLATAQPGEILNGRLARGPAIGDPNDSFNDQTFGKSSQRPTPQGEFTIAFVRLNHADYYFSELMNIVRAEVIHTADIPLTIIGGSLGFSCLWRVPNA